MCIIFLFIGLLALTFSRVDSAHCGDEYEVEIGKWPFQVVLGVSTDMIPSEKRDFYKMTDTEETTYLCSGTIIKKRWILTSARCITFLEANYKVIVRPYKQAKAKAKLMLQITGNDSIYQMSEAFSLEEAILVSAGDTWRDCGSQTLAVKAVFKHPHFQDSANSSYLNDIALIHLKNPVSFGYDASRVCLPSTNDWGRRDECFVTSWGHQQCILNNGKGGRTERITIWPNNQCKRKAKRYVDQRTQMCFGGEDDKACDIEPGRMVICLNRYDYFTIYGVLSYVDLSPGCSTATIGTRVSSYLPWIKETLIYQANSDRKFNEGPGRERAEGKYYQAPSYLSYLSM